MEKQIINVPKEVRYISEWDDVNKFIPIEGHSIINKTITGCGFTHYSLTNNIPTILCSPRKFLLENKYLQHSGILLVINSGEKSLDIDEDRSLASKSSKREFLKDENWGEIENIKSSIINYRLECLMTKKTPKILVTYDSLKYVVSALEDCIKEYSIIVDEFQNIFMDSSFKADTELSFLSYLQICPNVTYLSATPYIEEYLNELDEFKDLPYYELKWDPNKLRKIEIDFKKTSSLNREVDKIINNYLTESFPVKLINNEIYQSKEVVFYVNSVRMICNIIKRNGLTQDNTNIICADTEKNRKELGKLGVTIGKAPLKGQPHKMFTFCTRTTYVGADFYSTSAMSVIVSDCSIDSLSTDIRMDFPQIMGRQRLKENVFRDECIFIYKLSDKDITMEEFNKISSDKLKKSSADIETFNISKTFQSGNIESDNLRISNLLEDIRLRIKVQKYYKDYTGINERTGEVVINKLVYLSEKRAFELRSNVYKSDVQVYNEFEELISNEVSDELFIQLNLELSKLSSILNSSGRFSYKMEAVCKLLLDDRFIGRIDLSDIRGLSRIYKNYLNYLSPERIKALGYKEANIIREINSIQSGDIIKEKVLQTFLLRSKYTLKDIKLELSKIYSDSGITKTSKASDLLEYFNVKEVFIYDSVAKKQSKGYLILSLKE